MLLRLVEPGNYTSLTFSRKPADLRMRQSVGRTGVCWDNALAEPFFGALKNKWLNRFESTSRAKARSQVVRFIESFYNRRRLHSPLGYKTPQEAEDEYWNLQLVA